MIGPQKPPHAIEPLSATGEQPSIVACLGSSSTAGKGQAFNWITELQKRLGQRRFVFRNFGVGGDLAYNALQRLSGVIASCPKKIVVLIGGNDVLALVSTKARRFFRLSKWVRRDPSPEWFRENLQAIASRAKAETSAAIALCPLPPIGVDPMSANPFQSELNRRIEEFSAIIRGIAQEEGTDYIALYEAMFAQVMKSPGRAFTEFGFLAQHDICVAQVHLDATYRLTMAVVLGKSEYPRKPFAGFLHVAVYKMRKHGRRRHRAVLHWRSEPPFKAMLECSFLRPTAEQS